jgi:hypothetical protein
MIGGLFIFFVVSMAVVVLVAMRSQLEKRTQCGLAAEAELPTAIYLLAVLTGGNITSGSKSR